MQSRFARPELAALLGYVSEWDEFDVFELESISPTPLGTVLSQLLTARNLFVLLRIDAATFRRFAERLESEYLNNPVRCCAQPVRSVTLWKARRCVIFWCTKTVCCTVPQCDSRRGCATSCVRAYRVLQIGRPADTDRTSCRGIGGSRARYGGCSARLVGAPA